MANKDINNTNIIDSNVLSSISHLELMARQAVEGAVSGLHHSRFLGRNVEFSEHRPYNPGDELRHIDWRVYARTDRFHVKLFEEDTNLQSHILVDLSGSMRFGDSTVSKEIYAKQLAAALSYLMLGQGDSVGLITFDHVINDYIPSLHRIDQWGAIIKTLSEARLSQEISTIGSVLSSVGEYLKKRGMVILISDLIDDPNKVLKNLALLQKRKQEVIVFQILTPEEIELPYHGTVEFNALEGTIEPLLTTPKRLKKSYREKVSKFLDTYRIGCLEIGIDYQLIRMDQPLDQVLREYLQKRLQITHKLGLSNQKNP